MGWLTSRPVWVLVIACVLIALIVGVVSRTLALAIHPPEQRAEAHTIAAALMTAFAAAFALLTALTLATKSTRYPRPRTS